MLAWKLAVVDMFVDGELESRNPHEVMGGVLILKLLLFESGTGARARATNRRADTRY